MLFRSVNAVHIAPSGESLSTETETSAYMWKPDGTREADLAEAFPFWDEGVPQVIEIAPDGRRALIQKAFSEQGYLVDYRSLAPLMEIEMQPGTDFRFTSDASFLIEHQPDNGHVRLHPVYKSTQALINTARSQVTRTLTPAERERFFLSPASSADAE